MIKSPHTDISFARQLDAADELAAFRNEFAIDDNDTIYLDGNSLGRLPRQTITHLKDAVEHGWGTRLIRVWNDGWIETPTRLGGKIAALIGARPDEVIVTDSTSINLFKLAVAALKARPERTTIVSDVFNFPSDLYIFQGIIDLLGQRHQLKLVPSADTITISPRAVADTIADDTALVALTHVAFKSAFMYDMASITRLAHQAGALMLWDLSHSTGAVPVDLNGAGVDLAVGCTYKYLNGGPGAPAFLYVRKELQTELVSPVWGWFSARKPFDFDLDFNPANDIKRFWGSTQPMLSMQAIEPAVDLLLKANINRLRRKSVDQTEYLIFLAESWLLPHDFSIGSPRDAGIRGSHVSLRHPEAFRINQALIDPSSPGPVVIPDFREPDNIRLGVAPLYNTFEQIHRAIARIREIVEKGIFKDYSATRQAVT
jgi:kynureninase